MLTMSMLAEVLHNRWTTVPRWTESQIEADFFIYSGWLAYDHRRAFLVFQTDAATSYESTELYEKVQQHIHKLQATTLERPATFIHLSQTIDDVCSLNAKLDAFINEAATLWPITLTKEFSFAYGHHLSRRQLTEAANNAVFGPCYRYHGHNMRLLVSVRGWRDATTGMVINFNQLKRIVEETILAVYDHQTVEFSDAPPTCETMAPIFWESLKPRLPILFSITLYETPTSYCTIEHTKEM